MRHDVGCLTYSRLASIDLSENPFSTIPSPSNLSGGTFPSLTTLILLSSRISSWSDIDALERWTAGRLSTLRFSLYEGVTMKPVSETLSGVDLESKEASTDRSRDQAEALADSSHKDGRTVTERISGYARNDRLMFIAILSSLTVLNSTPVSASDRRDAEMWYVNHLGQGASPSDTRIGRYDELRLKYGVEARAVEPPKLQGLRSKMLSEWRQRDIGYMLNRLGSTEGTRTWDLIRHDHSPLCADQFVA